VAELRAWGTLPYIAPGFTSGAEGAATPVKGHRALDVRDKRDLYNGFGNGLSRAFEFAFTPVVFGGLGYAVDRRLDLIPVVTIVAVLFGLTGMFLRMWYGYDREMKAHEQRGPWSRRP
jgi:hypothetical protein